MLRTGQNCLNLKLNKYTFSAWPWEDFGDLRFIDTLFCVILHHSKLDLNIYRTHEGFLREFHLTGNSQKKAMQHAVQTIWKSNFLPIVFFNFCLMIFKVSKVIALWLRFFLFLRFLAFFNPLRRDLVYFLLLSNFLKPRKLWMPFKWTKYLSTVFAETLPYS